ncbi:MAG: DUF983 domain-containing protein [Alphaproteobacteria bacterium]|nr:DUF983 domain-containing protein [Alphaproteobacteria bacterium]
MSELEYPAREEVLPPRDRWLSIRRGFAGQCPHCGQGAMFGRYLKVNPQCASCGEDLSHHRADDLPAYIVLFIVGHVVIGTLMSTDAEGVWPLWLHMIIWPFMTLILSLAFLQPVKGAVVGLQWALCIYGFGGDET